MKIRPLGSKVLLRPVESEEKSESGIYLGKSDRLLLTGVIVSIGKDVTEELKEGDVVTYEEFSGHEIGGFILIPEHDLGGVIEKEVKTCKIHPFAILPCVECEKNPIRSL
jgi:chaperonin GroES